MEIVNEPKTIEGLRVIQDPKEMVEALKNGESFYHWEMGDSLSPLINNMEYCKITPCVPIDVKRGDCVFCVIKGDNGTEWPMVHQVWEISNSSHNGELWFKIGSTGTSIFGWTKEVYGIAKGTDIYQVLTNEMIEAMEREKEESMVN